MAYPDGVSSFQRNTREAVKRVIAWGTTESAVTKSWERLVHSAIAEEGDGICRRGSDFLVTLSSRDCRAFSKTLSANVLICFGTSDDSGQPNFTSAHAWGVATV